MPSRNFKIDLKDNKLLLLWDEDNKTVIDKLTFTQGTAMREYILSNFVSTFEVPYQDFTSFKAGEVTVKLASATSKTSSLASRKSQYSNPATLTFTATKHLWSSIDLDQVSISEEIPWKVRVGESIHLVGTTLNGLRNKIVVE